MRLHIFSFVAMAALLSSGCEYEPFPNYGAGTPANVISGTVTIPEVDLAADEATGIRPFVLVFATDARNPMPPLGTGRPVRMNSVTADEFSVSESGIRTASYTITNVPDGEWMITAVLDMDTDFHLRSDFMGGATCGDYVGGHYADLTATELSPISIEGGHLYDDVTVTVSTPILVERPAFFPLKPNGDPGTPGLSLGDSWEASYGDGEIVTYKLATTGVHAAYLDATGAETLTYDLDGPYEVQSTNPLAQFDLWDGSQVCETAFLVTVLDEDGDGLADPHPSYPAPILNIWPNFGLIYMGTPVDDDGDDNIDRFEVDPAYETGEGHVWKAPGVVSPGMALLGSLPPPGVPALMSELELLFLPAALHDFPATEAECTAYVDSNPDITAVWYYDQTNKVDRCEATVRDISLIPRGAYSITALSSTGQTWNVPNELPVNYGRLTVATDSSFKPGRQMNWVNIKD